MPAHRPSASQRERHQPSPSQRERHQPSPWQRERHQPSPSQRERHQPAPCNQQDSSSLWLSRRSDFTAASRSRRKAAASLWPVAGSRAPWKSMNPARHRNRAANPSSGPRVTNSIAPGPSRDVVIRNKSRPPGLSASSHKGSGWVAPAFATIASTGSNEVPAPSAWITLTCGQSASAARASCASAASISTAVTCSAQPTNSAMIAVSGAAAEVGYLFARYEVEMVEQIGVPRMSCVFFGPRSVPW
jgi:hypothetical protein